MLKRILLRPIAYDTSKFGSGWRIIDAFAGVLRPRLLELTQFHQERITAMQVVLFFGINEHVNVAGNERTQTKENCDEFDFSDPVTFDLSLSVRQTQV